MTVISDICNSEAANERVELLAALREAGAALRVNALRSGVSHDEIDAHPIMQRISAALAKAEEPR